MPSSDFALLWLHLVSLVVYGGGTLALLVLVVPLARQAPDPQAQRSLLAGAFKIYDPLMIAALGITVMTGAVNLTSYKDTMRGEFFARMGWLLTWKLLMAFLVIMLGTYLTFGIGHRIVSNAQWEEHADPAWLAGMVRRLIFAGTLNLALLAVTAWLGLAIGHPGH